MTKQASVATIKRGRAASNVRKIPMPGTKLRDLYDLLYDNRGKIIFVDDFMGYTKAAALAAAIIQLRDGYGFDVRYMTRYVAKQRWGQHHCALMLAGEHDGRAYIDYVTEHQ